MTEPRLKSGVWIDALIRRAQVGGAVALVSRSGDRDAGTVLVVVRGRDALTLYAPERDMEGARVWRATSLAEAELADAVDRMERFPERVMLPGIAISLTVLGVNYLGDGLRDALDPRIRGR